MTAFKGAIKSDLIFIENGSSVELPLLLLSFFIKKPFILHVGDVDATISCNKKIFRSILYRTLQKRVRHTIFERPCEKPEILPFDPYPNKEIEEYEKSWHTHILEIHKILNSCL